MARSAPRSARYRARAFDRSSVLKPDIARAQGQAVRLAHRRHADDVYGDVQINHHPPNHRELLRVLLAEIRNVWLDDIEQFRHDGRDTIEVARAELPAQPVRDALDGHGAERLDEVHLADGGHEHHLDATVVADSQIGVERPRDTVRGRPCGRIAAG